VSADATSSDWSGAEQLMLHRREPAEVLPVRILDPPIRQRFARNAKRVLQIVQTHQQTNAVAGRTIFRRLTISKRHIKPAPVDLPSLHTQRMIQVQQLPRPTTYRAQPETNQADSFPVEIATSCPPQIAK
jgi:hypothetical protein